MQINRPALKSDAKAAMRESVKSPFITALVFVIISYLLAMLNIRLTGIAVDYSTYKQIMQSASYEEMLRYLAQFHPSFPAQFLSLLVQLMASMLGVGMTMAMLQVHRRREHSIGTLFDGFSIFFRVLLLLVLVSVFVTLWSLLLFVPGIIAAYRYRLAIYIMIDNPKLDALECIRESKRLMKGYKWQAFVLDLSFLGWTLLTAIPFVSVYVSPYVHTTYAGFYEAVLNADTNRIPDASDPFAG